MRHTASINRICARQEAERGERKNGKALILGVTVKEGEPMGWETSREVLKPKVLGSGRVVVELPVESKIASRDREPLTRRIFDARTRHRDTRRLLPRQIINL